MCLFSPILDRSQRPRFPLCKMPVTAITFLTYGLCVCRMQGIHQCERKASHSRICHHMYSSWLTFLTLNVSRDLVRFRPPSLIDVDILDKTVKYRKYFKEKLLKYCYLCIVCFVSDDTLWHLCLPTGHLKVE